MIINPYSEAADMTQVISLNETAAWLWKQVEEKGRKSVDTAPSACYNHK